MYDLRDRLRKMNSNLLIRYGKTEVVATNVVRALQANGDTVKVFLQQQVRSSEERWAEIRRADVAAVDLRGGQLAEEARPIAAEAGRAPYLL